GLIGCAGSSENEGAPLLVMAAASLNEAMPEIVARFEESSGQKVGLVLGATGSLAAQIENGAPADVFFGADEATAARLTANGSLRPETERIYATGGLALVWRAGITPPASLASVADPIYETIAIA